MTATDGTDLRQELRAWLDKHPPPPAPADAREGFAHRRNWQRELADGGWAAPTWPVQYGGRKATLLETAAISEELAEVHAPSLAGIIGVALVGPMLLHHGSGEQKARFLQPMLSGEEIWCLGLSEPDAGSDLSAARTIGAPEPGGWRITGQKVWTSQAHHARWCGVLFQTDPQAPRYRRFGFGIVDMEQSGIDIRPLRQITGDDEFNEVFFDEVWVPDDMLVGEPGTGWDVVITILMNERAGLAFGFILDLHAFLNDLVTELARRGLLDDPVIADRVGDVRARCIALRALNYSVMTAHARVDRPGPEGSLTKLLWSDTNQRATELAVEFLGASALELGSRWSYDLLRARGNSIEGGTSEIQKSIVAERLLGLPRSS